MARSSLLSAALSAAVVLAAAAAPAAAVEIRHTSRVGGDPDAARVPATRGAPPPADTSGPHYFDKAHDGSGRG